MSESLGRAVLTLETDDAGLKRGLDTAETKTTRSMEEIGKKMTTAGRRMTVGLTLPLVALATKSISAASNLEEAVNIAEQAFGSAADEVLAWSESSAEAMGIAQAEALQAASTFRIMLGEMGLAPAKANDMSMSLIELASDMASAFNEDPIAMLDKLRSGLTGEIEPLRRMGILLNANAVEAKAMEMGLAGASGEVSESAKVQARYALILDQTETVQGDFARTSDSAANAQRIASAEFEDASAALGQKLLPTFTATVQVLTKLFQGFADLPGPVMTAVVAFGALVAAAGPAVWIGGKLLENWRELQRGGRKLAGVLRGGIHPAVIGATVAIGVGLAVWNQFRKEAERNAEVQRAFEDAIRASGDAVEGTNAVLAETVREFDALSDTMENAGTSFEDLSAGINGTEEDFEALKESLVAEAMDDNVLKASMLSDELDRLRRESGDAKDALEQERRLGVEPATEATGELAGATGELTGELGELGGQAGATESELLDLADALDAAFASMFSVEQATITYEDKLAGLTETLRSNGSTIDTNTEAGRANREELIAMHGAALDVASAMHEQGASTDEVNDFLHTHSQRLQDAARDAGLSEEAIAILAEEAGRFPAEIRTKVEADTAEAERKIKSVQDALDLLNRTVVTPTVGAFGGGAPARRHSGGPVQPRVPVLVGTAGHEELFIPEVGGDIVSHRETERILDRSGDGGDWHAHFHEVPPARLDDIQRDLSWKRNTRGR